MGRASSPSEGKNPPDREGLRRAIAFGDLSRRAGDAIELCSLEVLLQAFGPDGVDAEGLAALVTEDGETRQHQQAALAVLFAKAGLYGYGIEHDIAEHTWIERHGSSFSGAEIIAKLIGRADNIAGCFQLTRCILPHPAREFDDPARFRECLHAIQQWASENLGKGDSIERKRPPLRIIVDIDRKTITLDGKAVPLNSKASKADTEKALRWVKALAERPGEWLTSANLGQIDDQLLSARPDKFKHVLPDEINALIESRTGAGSRLTI
jgi:hypothetical protein